MTLTRTMSCDYCEGDYLISDIEPPDHSVGINGYTVFIDNTKFSTHDPDCEVRTMTLEQIEKIEVGLAIKVAEGYFDYEP